MIHESVTDRYHLRCLHFCQITSNSCSTYKLTVLLCVKGQKMHCKTRDEGVGWGIS